MPKGLQTIDDRLFELKDKVNHEHHHTHIQNKLTGGLGPSPSKYANTNSVATQSFSTHPMSRMIRDRDCVGSEGGAVRRISSGVCFVNVALGKMDFSCRKGD